MKKNNEIEDLKELANVSDDLTNIGNRLKDNPTMEIAEEYQNGLLSLANKINKSIEKIIKDISNIKI